MTQPPQWIVRIAKPLGTPWLTANVERQHYVRSRYVRAWRQATADACLAARLPYGVSPVTIYAEVHYASRQAPVKDRLNLANTIKAVVDGLTPQKMRTGKDGIKRPVPGYGFLIDDSDRHVLDTAWSLVRSQDNGIKLILTGTLTTHETPTLFDPETLTTKGTHRGRRH
jgi:hypothetical protein